MPTAEELVANELTTEQIAKYIGADRLFYQDLDDLINAVWQGNKDITKFDTSCFSGCYATGDITPEYLESLSKIRNDKEQEDNNISESTSVGIHNGETSEL